MNRKVEASEREKTVEDDWKFAAIVMDRVCLITLSTFITLSSIALFALVPDLLASF